MVFVLEGELFWELENEAIVPVYGGNFVLLPAGRQHRILNGLYPPSRSFWLILNDPAQNLAPALMTKNGLYDFNASLGRNGLTQKVSVRSLEAISGLSGLMSDTRIYTGSSLLIAELRSELNMVMVEAWKSQNEHPKRQTRSDLIEGFLAVFQENPESELNVSDVCNRLGYSRSFVHKHFREEVGMSPSDYMQRLRIKRCCTRLISTDASVTEVAFDFGFGSSQYFSRVFKKYIGTTPSGYREKMQGSKVD